jgi:energy-coupling factor transport system substrate-specific component
LAKGPLKALHPGLKYLLVGFWFTGGTVIPYLIRRPGAALAGELVAAGVQGLITQWGWTSLLWGLVQGAGSEVVFLATGYRRWNLWVFMAAGAVAGVFSWVLDFFYDNYSALGALTWLIQVVSASVSGAVLAGLLAWQLGKGLEKAGIRPSGGEA